MELSTLFSWNTDNLFKFLFINGIVLVVISLFYPLQKQQALELEKIQYDQKVELINLKISKLKNEVRTFDLSSKAIENKINKLKNLKDLKSKLLIEQLKNKFNNTFDSIAKSKNKLEVEESNIKSDRAKIELLKKHSEEYRQYSNWFLKGGLFSFAVGLIGWSWMTYMNESFKSEELKKIRKENNV